MLPETITRRVSFAVRILDDVTGLPLTIAALRIPAAEQDAIAKPGGFYVFTGLQPGTQNVEISSPRHQDFVFSTQTPVVAGTPNRITRVPGENERILPIQAVLTPSTSVRIAATDFHPGFPVGATVIHPSGQTTLTAPLTGENVNEVELDSITGLATNQFIRVLGDPSIRLRPGPYYDLSSENPTSRRLIGTVRNAVTSEPIAGARVEIRRANGQLVTPRTLGPTPATLARFSSIRDGSNRRVVGHEADVVSLTDERGRFAFRFPPRRELVVDNVRLRVTATDFNLLDTAVIDLTLADETVHGPALTRS